jgi:hypothetical protein
MKLFGGAGLHRYTKRHLRADRDATREQCGYVGECLRHTASELGTSVVEAIELREQLARALEAVERYATAVSTGTGVRDTSRTEDQATVPVDVRAWRAAHAGDYLDATQEAWQPVPLADSPLAKAPVGPALLEVRLDEPTAENRFPATARINDPDRLLSRLLDEAGKVTVSGGPRPATA